MTELTEDRIAFMERCLELRLQGVSYNDMARIIAEETGKPCEYTTVRKAVKEALAQSVTELADEVRHLELQRLDQLLLAHWDARNHPRHADLILKIMERRSKFLGLDEIKSNPEEMAEVLRSFLMSAAQRSGAPMPQEPSAEE